MKEDFLKPLMDTLGYHFKQWRLLGIALTHRSKKEEENNERLEFLGDAVLGGIITAQLFQQFPHASEGELSRLRSHLVNESSLAALAQKFKIGGYLRLGLGELKSGGASRNSILADTVEAMIGAIYLDAGSFTCEKVILGWFEERLKVLDQSDMLKDPKTLLQEYMQSHKRPLPHYTVISVTGESHQEQFEVSCEVEGITYRPIGRGTSRRGAEQMAAALFLKELKSLKNKNLSPR